ncbi:hypothetical protein ACFE04_026956 [Oxalis oulophora]
MDNKQPKITRAEQIMIIELMKIEANKKRMERLKAEEEKKEKEAKKDDKKVDNPAEVEEMRGACPRRRLLKLAGFSFPFFIVSLRRKQKKELIVKATEMTINKQQKQTYI